MGKSMSKQLSVETMVSCSEYQRLLDACPNTLKIWNEQREEIYQSRLCGTNVGNELRRLQAKYTRADTVLRNHEHNCLRCQLVSRIEERDSKNNSDVLSDSKQYV
jgi:hypothetical protein